MVRGTIGQIFRACFDQYARQHGLCLDQHKAARALMACRTEMMGGYEAVCPSDDYRAQHYYSCRHRSCPQCNSVLNAQWLDQIKARLLPCQHFHVIFTLPHELNALWGYNREWFSDHLFSHASQSLRELLRDPRHLGAEVGMILAEHTWGRTLVFHPHVHCLVSAGGLRDTEWVASRNGYLVPGRALSALFRGKWLDALNRALEDDVLRFPSGFDRRWAERLLIQIAKKRWNVRVEGQYTEGAGVVVYLSRYLRGGPIGDRRIESVNDGRVVFHYQDHRDHQLKRLSLPTDEFLRRLLSHISPQGRHRIRYYGLYRPQAQKAQVLAGQLLGKSEATQPSTVAPAPARCPHCGALLQRHLKLASKNSIYRDPNTFSVQPEVQPNSRPDFIQRFRDTGPPASFLMPNRESVN